MMNLEWFEIECFWCEKVFDGTEYNRCPHCSSNLQTGEIQIQNEEEN